MPTANNLNCNVAAPPTVLVATLPGPRPDRSVLARFVHALFKHADPRAFISLRGFDQSDSASPPIHIEAVAADFASVVDRAVYVAGLVAEARGVFAPPVCTFVSGANAREANVAQGLTLSVDIDNGDSGAKRAVLEGILGRATLVVASGGEWPDPATGAVHDKVHLHWRLAVPTATPEDHARLADARRWAAQIVGGDDSGSPLSHPLRWAGSVHMKGEPRLARIVAQTEAEVSLDTALDALQAAGSGSGIVLRPRVARTAAQTTYTTIEDDQPRNVERFAEHCRRAEPAVPGVWHDLSRNLAAEAVRCAVSVDKALEVMLAEWVPRGIGFFDEGRHERWAADVAGSYQWALGFREHGAHSVDTQLSALSGADIVPPPAAPTATADAQEADAPPLLDPAAPMDSALAFIERRHTVAGRRVLCFQGGTFYRWTGTHYAEATREELSAQVWRFLHSAFKQGKNGVWPFNPTTAKVGDVVTATGAACQMPASTRAPSWIEAGAYPAPQGIVACANGLLDLATGKLRASTPAFFTLNSLPFAYEPNASEPAEWLGFLNTLWPSDPDSRDTLQEIFGLLLTAETRFQKAFLLVGPKRSGKGTIAWVLTCLLGQDNVCGPTLGQLGQQFGAAPLIGKRLAIIADARLGGRADAEAVAERILNITGEDSQTIDRKFRDAWTGKLDARLLIISNELPRLSDASGALASRLITLVLTESFYGREDQGLTDRLTDELPGILNWAIAGWRRLAARKRFNPPLASREAQQEMEDLGSPISVFVRERCVVGLDAKARPETLYQAWRFWCAEQGRTQPGTLATFCRDLRAALSTVTRRQETVEGARVWFYGGIGLPSPMRGIIPPPGG